MNVQLRPIGVFDSGVGGLSVLRALRPILPAEDVLYFADSAHCPYGSLPPAAILARAEAVAATLLDRGAKLLVVACNTASSVALPALRARFPDLPIVGTVPAVKPAAAATRSGRIAVLATPRTVAGPGLAALVRDHAPGLDVVLVPAPGLVELVESGQIAGPRADAALRPLLAPLLARGVDTLVLGCTHYPFLRDAIRAVAGPDLTVIDSGDAIADRTRALLDADDLRNPAPSPGSLILLTSGSRESLARLTAFAGELLAQPVVPGFAAGPSRPRRRSTSLPGEADGAPPSPSPSPGRPHTPRPYAETPPGV